MSKAPKRISKATAWKRHVVMILHNDALRLMRGRPKAAREVLAIAFAQISVHAWTTAEQDGEFVQRKRRQVHQLNWHDVM